MQTSGRLPEKRDHPSRSSEIMRAALEPGVHSRAKKRRRCGMGECAINNTTVRLRKVID